MNVDCIDVFTCMNKPVFVHLHVYSKYGCRCVDVIVEEYEYEDGDDVVDDKHHDDDDDDDEHVETAYWQRKLGAVRGEEVKLAQRCAKKRLFRKAVSQRNNGSET